MSIRNLAYVGVNVADIDGWATFASDILGMAVEEDRGGRIRLRLDDRIQRVSLYAGTAEGQTHHVAHIGWEVEDDRALELVRKRLSDAGVAINEGADDERDDRGVAEMIWFDDPSGYRVEICHGQMWKFADPPVAGSVGGPAAPAHLAHLVVETAQLESSLHVYRDMLGFKLSDYRHERMYFLRCSPRHHSIGLARGEAPRLYHFALEYPEIDDVGRRWDAARSAGIVTRHLGRHSNDRAVSFYLRTPSGFEVELGTPGIEVDEATWLTREISTGDLWGHHRAEDTSDGTASL